VTAPRSAHPDDLKSRVQQVFDASAPRYARDREGQPGFQRQAAWVMAAAGEAGGRRVLEVGCGPGSLVEPLRRAGFSHVAVDLSAAMLARCRDRCRGLRLPALLARADAEALPFHDGTFDLVVAVGLIEYLPSAAAFLSESARVLRPQGRLLLSVPSAASPYAVAAGAFGRLPLRLRARLLGRDPRQPLHLVRARPARVRRLRSDLARAGFETRALRFSQFVFFPLDRVVPRLSAWLAERLEPLGEVPGLARLGAQILTEAARAPGRLPAGGARTRAGRSGAGP